MYQPLVIRKVKETYVTALIYNETAKDAKLFRFYVPGWHPDPGGRKLIKAIKQHYKNTDETLIRVEGCRLGYCRYELPLQDFMKQAKKTHVDQEQKVITD